MTNYLASELQLTSVGEFARDYLSKVDGQYEFEDLEAIARGQLAMILDAGCWMRDAGCGMLDAGFGIRDEEGAKRVVITDTFLLVILIWSMHKYGKVSDTVQELYAKYQPDFYLLCRPDLPWERDVLREHEQGREELFERYLERIEASGIPYFIVEGSGPARMQKALDRVAKMVQKKLP